jgi:hypothetical protein
MLDKQHSPHGFYVHHTAYTVSDERSEGAVASRGGLIFLVAHPE